MRHPVYCQKPGLTPLELRGHFANELLSLNFIHSLGHWRVDRNRNTFVVFSCGLFVDMVSDVNLNRYVLRPDDVCLLLCFSGIVFSLDVHVLGKNFCLSLSFFKVVGFLVNQSNSIVQVVHISHHTRVPI